MAKKERVEVNEETMNIDLGMVQQEIPLQEIHKREVKREEPVSKTQGTAAGEPVNCLRAERVIVRFVPRPTAMVQNPNHILYGGMADNATRSFVVPRLSTGQFKNILTDNEKAYLEKAMGLEMNALSVYKKVNNFWDDSNPDGIGRVILHKQDNYLDLSDPSDYIKYKILLANKDQIASSTQELQDRPKVTYQYVIISENAESEQGSTKMDTIQRCYMEYGKVEHDLDTLKTIIELLEGKVLAPRVKADVLKTKINEHIQRNPRMFLSTIQDLLLPYKVLIRKCVEKGLIGKRNDAYYLREGNVPLCELGEDSTLNNAAKYLSNIKRQELKYRLEAQVKE